MSRKDEMKQVVESLVANLAKQGVKVTNAAILSLGDDNVPTNVIDEAVKNAVSKLGLGGLAKKFPGVFPRTNTPAPTQEEVKAAQEQINQVNQEAPAEKCFCPSCFNFETFEEVLKGEGAQFDYQTVTLLGKKFDIKFYNGPEGEKMMVSPQTFQIDPEWTTDTLIGQLNNAVAQKEFDKAQILLNELNNRKTNSNE